ncbi:MAG: hypothetical protein FWD90_13230 [Defluviitaleaceae bacterium]|nr:hypothetical protein [Defluviitaleaceae bacterium]
MDFRFIDDGTRMDIQHMNDANATIFYGIFVRMEKGVSFYVSCDPLYERFEDLNLAQIYTFTFFRGAEAYSFDAKILERKQLFNNDVLLFTATSLVKKYNRRNAHRIRVQMSISLYEKKDDNPNKLGDMVCKGEMYDVSRSGLTLLSNERVNLQLRKVYMSEFVANGITFRFPVEFVRGGERSLSPMYRYDYAFMYNNADGDLTEELNRLTLALFEHQLKGGLGK